MSVRSFYAAYKALTLTWARKKNSRLAVMSFKLAQVIGERQGL